MDSSATDSVVAGIFCNTVTISYISVTISELSFAIFRRIL